MTRKKRRLYMLGLALLGLLFQVLAVVPQIDAADPPLGLHDLIADPIKKHAVVADHQKGAAPQQIQKSISYLGDNKKKITILLQDTTVIPAKIKHIYIILFISQRLMLTNL